MVFVDLDNTNDDNINVLSSLVLSEFCLFAEHLINNVMHHLQQFCNNINCSFRELSLFLGTHHAHLSRVINGTRTLHPDVAKLVLHLNKSCKQREERRKPINTVTAREKQVTKFADQRIRFCKKNLRIKSNELEKMKSSLDRNRSALANLEHLLKNSYNLSLDQVEWLHKHRTIVQENFKKFTEVDIYELEMKVAVLQFEMEWHLKR